MRSAYIIYSFFFMFWASSAFSQAGSIDPEFGEGDGLVTASIYPEAHAYLSSVTLQSDGKILVTGGTNVPGGFGEAVIMRLLPDGSYDNTFNGNGKIIISNSDSHCYGISSVVLPDSKIVSLVNLSNGTLDSFALHRFLSDGTPDNSFNTDGVAYTNLGTRYQGATSLRLQSDSKLVVGGYIQGQSDTFNQFFITRFMPNGTLDQSFDGDGKAFTRVGEAWSDVRETLIQPDGKIISIGYGLVNGKEKFAIVRYKANGSLDETFSEDGITTVSFGNYDDSAAGVVLQPDGKIVVAGFSGSATGNTEFAVCRLTTGGDPDNTFHGDGLVTVPVSIYADAARSILLQPDGKLIVGGYVHSNQPGGSDLAIVRLTENGIPDFTFDGDGIATFSPSSDNSDDLAEMAWQPDGKIVAAGYSRFGNYNSMTIARFISGIMVGARDADAPDIDVELFPNPMIDQVVVNYELESNETIGINLYDVQGKMVQPLLTDERRNAGQHTEVLHLNGAVSPGTYFLNIESGHWMKSVKVVVD